MKNGRVFSPANGDNLNDQDGGKDAKQFQQQEGSPPMGKRELRIRKAKVFERVALCAAPESDRSGHSQKPILDCIPPGPFRRTGHNKR